MLENTKKIIEERQIPALYELDGKPHEEIQVKIKFHDLFGSWEWYGWEAEVSENDVLFFGYVKGFETEMGYFSLSEMISVNRNNSIPRIVIDTEFEPITLEELKQRLVR